MNRVQTSFTVPTNLGKILANINIIYCKGLFRHVGKQDKTRARTSMVKIALRKLFAGILCGCVVLLVLVVKWAMNKTIQTYPHSDCTFHHQSSQRVQTSFTVPTNVGKTVVQHNLLYVSLSACWKIEQKPCKNNHGENCIAQVVCWYFVRGCVVLGLVVKWVRKKTIQTYPHSNCTFHHQNSQRVQTNFTVPTNLGNFGQHNLLVQYVSLSACWKIGLNPFNNKHGENCIVQVVCWYSVWLRSAAGACQLWWMIGKKRSIISKPHSNCTFSQPEFTKKIRALYHTIQPQGKSIYLSLSLSIDISRSENFPT